MELKIKSRGFDDGGTSFIDVIKGSTITDADLTEIANFIPYLEIVYLDDVFNENLLFDARRDMLNNSDGSGWKAIAHSLQRCPEGER